MRSLEETCTGDSAMGDLRFATTWADNDAPFADHPRTIRRTLAVDRLSRALRSSDDMAPSEIFDACCESVATALDLTTAVVIEGFGDVARSLSWKRPELDWSELSSAEAQAWDAMTTSSSTDGPACAPWPAAGQDGEACGVVALAPPLRGILQCRSSRALDEDDLALLNYMATRLSFALYRYDMQWERP